MERRDRDGFGFLTNHGRALLCLAQHPGARMRDVAERLGITERAVQRIVADLEAAGYLRRARQGRRNLYEVDAALPLRHPAEGASTVQALLSLGRAPSAPPPSQRAHPERVAPADTPRAELSFID